MALCPSNEAQRHIPGPQHSAPANDRVIFVVEEDPSIRNFICRLLKQVTGALVLDSAAPDLALSLARSIGRPIDLLVSDIDLGAAQSGIDLAYELARSGSLVAVLLISGRDAAPYDLPPGWRFLAKPFPVPDFLQCVSELCRASQGPRHNNP
ncbi:MAG TPA: hypothetical protein VKU19_13450 [Bryobacteraceae bacterium]|nr:hypothetical protein [Bryobacteraceae bacterium]